jgi:octaprenyl-diphosphate synthase
MTTPISVVGDAAPRRRASSEAARDPLMDRLSSLCRDRGLGGLAARLGELSALAGGDLAAVEAALAETAPRDGERRRDGARPMVVRAASHLLELGGKRLRPLCVALAARCGEGFGEAARELAVAVELVHSATLLHDDVVDLGERRRGAPTARAVYGNAASIFAGDWLLVEALRRVRETAVDGALAELLDVIGEMILAESIQLERRGRLDPDRASWLRVVEGKTASLFRWAMYAGARAGRLDEARAAALARYGQQLGVAFQAVDDLLDFTGSETVLGKALFTDLREGKMTYPMILAVEREPALLPRIERLAATLDGDGEGEAAAPDTAWLVEALGRTGAVDGCRAFARARAAEAVGALEVLPPSEARDALATVALAAVDRER